MLDNKKTTTTCLYESDNVSKVGNISILTNSRNNMLIPFKFFNGRTQKYSIIFKEVDYMNDKEKYINDVEKRFNGKAKKILLNQINLFYDDTQDIEKNKYSVGAEVELKQGTFIHGIFGEL